MNTTFTKGKSGNPAGRPPGPNKTTKNAREAIARLVDGNVERMQEWLDQIASTEGPLKAWQCMSDVIEYHIPKLSRTELTGKDGEKLPPAVFNIQPVKPSE